MIPQEDRIASSLNTVLATRQPLLIDRQIEIFRLLCRYGGMPADTAYSEILLFKEVYENSVTYEGRLLYVGDNPKAKAQQRRCLIEEGEEHLLGVIAELRRVLALQQKVSN